MLNKMYWIKRYIISELCYLTITIPYLISLYVTNLSTNIYYHKANFIARGLLQFNFGPNKFILYIGIVIFILGSFLILYDKEFLSPLRANTKEIQLYIICTWLNIVLILVTLLMMQNILWIIFYAVALLLFVPMWLSF